MRRRGGDDTMCSRFPWIGSWVFTGLRHGLGFAWDNASLTFSDLTNNTKLELLTKLIVTLTKIV